MNIGQEAWSGNKAKNKVMNEQYLLKKTCQNKTLYPKFEFNHDKT